MHINAFFQRSTAPKDLEQLFKPLTVSDPSKTAAADNARPDQSQATGKKSVFDVVKIIVDLIAEKNPNSVTVAAVQEGYAQGMIVRGSEQRDIVNVRAVTGTYLDSGGGDDTVAFSSNALTSHDVHSGDGNDTVAVTAYWMGTVDGGSGEDAIGVAGGYIGTVNGGSGNDAIAVAGGIVSSVDGGEGNDAISVSADFIGAVSGGDGDDVIAVSSDNRSTFAQGGGYGMILGGQYHAAIVEGGKGNDKISIDGEGHVTFRTGGGQDMITINDRTVVELASMDASSLMKNKTLDLDTATITNENGKVVVTFPGRDEKLTFQSANGGELRVEVLEDEHFVVVPASKEIEQAA